MMERFRAFWTKVFSPVARLFLRLGISPDAVTIVGTLGVCAGALVFFPQGKLLVGVLVITAFVFSDLVDGAHGPARAAPRRSGARSWTPRSTGSGTPRSSPGWRSTTSAPATPSR